MFCCACPHLVKLKFCFCVSYNLLNTFACNDGLTFYLEPVGFTVDSYL